MPLDRQDEADEQLEVFCRGIALLCAVTCTPREHGAINNTAVFDRAETFADYVRTGRRDYHR